MIEIVSSCFVMERVFLGIIRVPSWIRWTERRADWKVFKVQLNPLLAYLHFVYPAICGQAFCGKEWRTANKEQLETPGRPTCIHAT